MERLEAERQEAIQVQPCGDSDLNPDTFSQGMSVFTRPYVRGQGWNST